MRTITADELQLAPSSLVDGALRGEPAIVTVDRVPVMMVVPLGVGTGVHRILIDLAATLFDRGQVSLGTAARMSGLMSGEMINELGRRKIAIIRPGPGDARAEG